MTEPERPLFVMHTGAPGGSNQVVLSLLRHRPPAVEPACIFLGDGPVRARVRQLGIPEVFVPCGRAREIWRIPGIVVRLRAEIQRHRADLVFAHVPKAHAYASLAAALERLPYLWWQHDPPHLRPFVKRIAAKLPAQAVVCSSEFVAARQRQLGSRAPVVRIYCGIEQAASLELHRHAATTEATVGTVGRLQRYKRTDRLIRAAAIVLPSAPAVRFRVVGDASPGIDVDYPAQLVALARELDVDRAIDFAGHVDGVEHVFAGLDVLVHTAESEPFGLVVAEAMAHGIPVVCPDEGGPTEIVRDGIDGLHVRADDVPALADAIVRLAGDARLRERMGAAGRARVLAEFTAERMARETWELMERLCTREPSS